MASSVDLYWVLSEQHEAHTAREETFSAGRSHFRAAMHFVLSVLKWLCSHACAPVHRSFEYRDGLREVSRG